MITKYKYGLIGIVLTLVFCGVTQAQTQTGYRIPSRVDIGGGRMTGDMWCQYGTSGVRFIIGTQTVTQVGTAGVINGTNAAGSPSLDFTYGGGSLSANFNGFGAVYVAGSQVGTSGALTGKLDATGGAGTNNTFNNPTLAGQGTLTATLRANGVDISPAEISMTDGATISLNTATGSITNHTHTGSDGTTQIAHNNVTGTGTNSHAIIDTFIASKASASGLASLDANSLVVQNPANGTSNPTANKIVVALGTGKIDDGWISSSFAPGTPSFSAITGVPTDNAYFSTIQASNKVQYGIPEIYNFPATTTAIIGTSTNGRWYNLQKSAIGYDSYTKLLVPANTLGTSTFVDLSNNGHLLTGYGGTPVGTSTNAKFSGSCMYVGSGTGQYVTTDANADFNFSSGNWTIDFWFAYGGTPLTNTDFWRNGGAILCYLNGGGSGAIHYYLGTSDSGWEIASASQGSKTSYNANQLYHLELNYDGSNYRAFVDGTLDKIIASASSVFGTNTIRMGDLAGSPDASIYIDELRVSKGIARNTNNFTPPTSEYGASYNYHLTQYISSGTTTPVLQILDDGTNTTELYFLADVTTAIFGKGTTTDVLGTMTDYAVWADGAIRATAFNVASTKEIKENIETIKIKPDVLDAEAEAKEKYITDNKNSWVNLNQGKYETVITIGTGTTTYIDKKAMESDYSNYIELEWASDLKQDVLIENIQKEYEKGFWSAFKAIKPKSWNPEDNLNMIRKGFVVEEVPDEVKGDDKRSIDPMALIAYATIVLQSLKEELGSATAEIEKLKKIINP